MRLLELFAGTGSIGKVFKDKGWEVVSLDWDPKTDVTIHTDIRDWDYTTYPPKYFDMIWASPCCTHYSIARKRAKTPRNLEWADSLVTRTLEIVQYFSPGVFFIENPATGLLKTRPFMQDIPYIDVDYCCYCDWGYRKRTRLWNNTGMVGKLCPGKGLCPNMQDIRHKSTAQQGKNRSLSGDIYGFNHRRDELHQIPPKLVLDIYDWVYYTLA